MKENDEGEGQAVGLSRGIRPRRIAACALLVATVAGVSACGSSSKTAAGLKGKSEVTAQPVSSNNGTNPFMPAIGKDRAGIKPPAAAASSSGGPATYSASLPGLYGGTRDYKSCDANKLITYLDANPSKAQAWASTLGIQTSQISTYVDGLTPVLLRTDTRVTNHGYINGVADPIQSVLEAGTAVFVNQYGAPVVKCYCGNPLTPPVLYSSPTYLGPLWSNFSTTNITIIQQSTTIIKIFTLYDPRNGKTFQQTPGINGKAGPYQQPGGNTGTGTTPAPSTSTPAPAPAPNTTPSPSPAPNTTPAENPSVSLSPNPVVAGSTVTLSGSGFAPGASLLITVNRPDGGTDRFSASADGSGNVTYTFPNAGGSITGTYTVTVTNTSSGAGAQTTIDVLPPGGSTTPGTTT